jgi:hypothetical protein
MFDPTLGRWIEEDAEGFSAGDMNLYRYVGDNPIDETDPSGLEAVGTPKPPSPTSELPPSQDETGTKSLPPLLPVEGSSQGGIQSGSSSGSGVDIAAPAGGPVNNWTSPPPVQPDNVLPMPRALPDDVLPMPRELPPTTDPPNQPKYCIKVDRDHFDDAVGHGPMLGGILPPQPPGPPKP